jgi:uncharacterized protein (TIGR00369 family)
VIATEPVRGAFPEPGLLALSGIEQMRVWKDRQGPIAPIGRLTGVTFDDFSFNAASFSMPASPCWQTSAGVFLGATLALPGDVALSSAIWDALPPGVTLATAELSMNFLRPASPASERIHAHASLIHAGRSLGLSDVVIEDPRGQMLAHGTCRCMLLELPVPERPESFPPLEQPGEETPDPYLRPPEGKLIPDEVFRQRSGLELYQGWMAGEIPASPLGRYLDFDCTDASEGAVAFTMPASEWLVSALRTVYGGTLALFADAALTSAVQTTLPPATALAPLDLSVNFLRPVFPGGLLEARARVAHRGKTLAVANAEVRGPDGKQVAVAKGTAMILPGRPMSLGAIAPVDEASAAPDTTHVATT